MTSSCSSSQLKSWSTQSKSEEKPIFRVYHLTKSRHFRYLLNKYSNRLIVVEFSATWCRPCKQIYPYFEELSTQFRKVVFVYINVDQFDDLAEQEHVRSLPTFKFYLSNSLVKEFSGANRTKLLRYITKYNERAMR